MIPLEHSILYSANSYPNRYWTGPRNTTEWSVFMAELTKSGNAIADGLLRALTPKLHGAHLGKSTYPIYKSDANSPRRCVAIQVYLTRTRSSRTCSPGRSYI